MSGVWASEFIGRAGTDGINSRPWLMNAGMYPVASCEAVLYANFNAGNDSSHSRWSLSTYCVIIVLIVRFVRSTGLQCGARTVAVRCSMLNARNRTVNSTDLNCVPLSVIIMSGRPRCKIIQLVISVVTAFACLSDASSAHFENWSCTRSHVWPRRDRGRRPTRSIVTCFHGRLIFVACMFSAGFFCSGLCARQLGHHRTYPAILRNIPG